MELDELLTCPGVAVSVVGAQEGMHVGVAGGHWLPGRGERNVLLEANPVRAAAPLDAIESTTAARRTCSVSSASSLVCSRSCTTRSTSRGPTRMLTSGAVIEISIVTRSAAR